MKILILNLKTILIVVGTMITLPFAHMAGPEALANWAIKVNRMYEDLGKELDENKE